MDVASGGNGSNITVTPELLRTTAQKIGTNLEHAVAISNQYSSGHEHVVSGGAFAGLAAVTSLATAGQLDQDVQQIIAGCERLINGLNKTAALMEAHEADQVQNLSSLFGGDAGSSAVSA